MFNHPSNNFLCSLYWDLIASSAEGTRPGWCGWAATSAVQLGWSKHTASWLKLEIKFCQATHRQDAATPLNRNTNLSLPNSPTVASINSFTGWSKVVTAEKKWLDFIDSIISIWQHSETWNVINVLQCNQFYRASIKPINRVSKIIYWFCISYAVRSYCNRVEFW